jgi:sugar phosphate isomerase/epimerase
VLELSRKVGDMNIRERLYIATYADKALETIKKHNLGMESNHICITENLDDDKTMDNLINDIKLSECEDRFIIHGPFTEIIPMGIDRKLVKAGMDRLDSAAEFTLKAGAHRMVVHTGLITEMYYDSWHIEKSADFWQEFMANKPGDFNIMIENVFDKSPMALKEIVDSINDERIGICFDVGHANAIGGDYSVYDWIKMLGSRIKHFHIHNNYGGKDRHLPLGDGDIDYKEVFRCIDDYCESEVTYAIESMNCIDSVNWLIEEEYI